MDSKKRILNWKPSPKDPRDVPFAKASFLKEARAAPEIPKRVDMRDFCSPVEDQGALGSCTAQALVGACEMLQMRANAGLLPCELSRLFAYYNGRRAMGALYVKQDSGCFIRTVIKAAARVGICDEELWPYDEKAFAKKPSVGAYADATTWQLTGYASLNEKNTPATLLNIRRTLAAGFPVAFGFNVYPSLMSEKTAQTGIAPIPSRDEVSEGGHAVLAVGYDDERSVLIVRNSWGRRWGDKGYFLLPYWFILNGEADDFWAVTGQENGETAESGWFSGVVPYLFGHKERGAM